ncbi:DUF6526 family protein [Fluviicola taffensis]|uniref:Uncharacterized protein n=1 Tax=Fluviicola taffensis (strain DSM 16823 / NCIMB 13979 / RW262) TaxID=755732 RepID=F2IIU2_FLUTR|nr:DUF6526 family protein [Fluviicola taffensis]AEA42799.1 hypothetical protein Fluta_0796 [Fluviicola taffensis DSM 16823]
MAVQNKSNHRRLSPMYHGVLLLMVLSAIVISLYSFIKAISNSEELLLPLLLVIHSFVFLILMLLSRTFALKAQDRAIRAEESLRHFILTGKPINPKLRLGQIIALRFASDEELIELTEKTITENLNQNQIKGLINNWKADTHRV